MLTEEFLRVTRRHMVVGTHLPPMRSSGPEPAEAPFAEVSLNPTVRRATVIPPPKVLLALADGEGAATGLIDRARGAANGPIEAEDAGPLNGELIGTQVQAAGGVQRYAVGPAGEGLLTIQKCCCPGDRQGEGIGRPVVWPVPVLIPVNKVNANGLTRLIVKRARRLRRIAPDLVIWHRPWRWWRRWRIPA